MLCPTGPFTILEPQDQEIVEFCVVQESFEILKGSAGKFILGFQKWAQSCSNFKCLRYMRKVHMRGYSL